VIYKSLKPQVMKPNSNFFKSAQVLAGLLIVVFMSSCGSSYDNASVQNDGIYASDAVANENTAREESGVSNNNAYYQNYFDEQDQLISQARSQNDVFTNVDDYSSQGANEATQEDVIIDENATGYNSYGGWGTQPTSVTVNYIDNGFWGPNFGWGIQNNWAWGGLNPGWGWNRFGGLWGGIYGPGWGGLYGPGWGWGTGFGWGGAFGWGNFRPWGGWGVPGPYWGGHYGIGYNNLAFHRGYRNSLNSLNRGRSNSVSGRSRINRSNNNINGRSRISASRSRNSRYANADGRRIRNSSNVNARVRSNRANDRSATTTTRSRRSGYSNQSIYRGSSRGNSVRSGRNSRGYTPRSSSTRSRSTGSSSRARSSSRGSSSRSSGSRSSGGRSSRGGRR
jgi:hypothetical protein